MPIISINVLAPRAQSAYVHKRSRRAHEHGRAMERENGLRTRCRRIGVSTRIGINRFHDISERY